MCSKRHPELLGVATNRAYGDQQLTSFHAEYLFEDYSATVRCWLPETVPQPLPVRPNTTLTLSTRAETIRNKAYDAVLQKDGRYRIRINKIKALQLGSDAVVTGTVGGKEFCVTIQPLSYANIVLNKSAYATDDVARSAAASLYYYAYWSQHING